MTLDTPRRLRLFSGWRTRLTGNDTPATTTPSAAPEEGSQVGHIYPSNNAEPGQTTTALGRHHTAEHLIVTPRDTGERTQVIRVNPVREAAAALGLAAALTVSNEPEDPPIYLATVAAVERLRALPQATPDQPEQEVQS